MQCSNFNERDKGSILFLSLLLTLVLLGIGLGITEIIVSELRVLRGLGESVFAFGAADAGVEHGLYVDKISCNAIEPQAVADLVACVDGAIDLLGGAQALPNTSTYELVKPSLVSSCPGGNYCVESKGRFRQAIRKVQIAR